MAKPTKKTLGGRLKEAVHRHSFFGRLEKVADHRRHLFNERVATHQPLVRSAEQHLHEVRERGGNRHALSDAEQILFLDERELRLAIRKREYWRDRYVWAHQRHHHWGLVLKHRRDRLRRWVQRHKGFRPYMANGKPWVKLTPEAKEGIYRDFCGGLYVTSTYEGHPGDGVHATTSYHYLQNQPDGKARCWDAGSGTRGPMEKAQHRQARNWGSFLTEMFGPDNAFAYKNGVRFTLPEGSELETMHDNHVHTDIRDGAPLR